MPHIHTMPGQHDITASAFIIIQDKPPVILMHWHKKVHKWLQFGGHVELNEDPWQAVCHEIIEESGYNLSQLSVLQPKVRLTHSNADTTIHPVPVSLNTHPYGPGVDHFHTDIAYSFIADGYPAGKTASGESKKFKAFSKKELEALSLDEIPGNVRDIAIFILDNLLNVWEPVKLP